MRTTGRVSLVMGVLALGAFLLMACGSNQFLPTIVTAPNPTSFPSPLGSPATATASPGPALSSTGSATATVPRPSPSIAATATVVPSPVPSQSVVTQSPITLTSIHMMTAAQGWATGLVTGESSVARSPAAVGDVFRTTSGGTTWRKVSPQGVLSASINSAFFLDASSAWIAATAPVSSTGGTISTTMTIYGTIDGGQSWTKGNPFTLSAGGPATFSFADALHGWIMIGLYAATGSEAVEILKTVDGGVNWEPVSLAVNAGNQSTANGLPYRCNKNGITFVDAVTGWVAGSCPGGALFLYVTQDGGQTWQLQTPPAPPGDPASLFSDCQCAVDAPLFVSAQNGVLAISISQVNQGTYLYVTQDGGFTWVLRELPVTQLYGAPDFFDANDGVITDGQQLFVTNDGGQTWTPLGTLPISGTNLSGGIDFVDATDGWVTDGQHLYATHDGSQTWVTITPVVVPSPPTQPAPIDVAIGKDGQTLNLQVGQEFLLDLGSQYTWTVAIDNPAIVARVVNVTVVKGAQGIYKALRAGTATLSATGEPVCRQAQPPCATPSRQFQLTIVVQ